MSAPLQQVAPKVLEVQVTGLREATAAARGFGLISVGKPRAPAYRASAGGEGSGDGLACGVTTDRVSGRIPIGHHLSLRN